MSERYDGPAYPENQSHADVMEAKRRFENVLILGGLMDAFWGVGYIVRALCKLPGVRHEDIHVTMIPKDQDR